MASAQPELTLPASLGTGGAHQTLVDYTTRCLTISGGKIENPCRMSVIELSLSFYRNAREDVVSKPCERETDRDECNY